MEQIHFPFRAPNGYPSSCELTIDRSRHLVIVTETGEGMSVTNAAETIATEVVKRFGIDPNRMLFIEHYPLDQRPLPYGESYDLVTFTWRDCVASSPQWRHLPPLEAKAILSSL